MISDFDYPYPIRLVKITSGYTDQQSGEYIQSQKQVVEIKGHLQDITLQEISKEREGIYELGDRKLYTSVTYGIKTGDELEITEPDGSVTRWEVKSAVKQYYFLNKKLKLDRICYVLKPKQ